MLGTSRDHQVLGNAVADSCFVAELNLPLAHI